MRVWDYDLTVTRSLEYTVNDVIMESALSRLGGTPFRYVKERPGHVYYVALRFAQNQ